MTCSKHCVKMATKSLIDLDHHQNSIKNIVKDALEQVDILKKNLEISEQHNTFLTQKNKELMLNATNPSYNNDLREKNQMLINELEELKKKLNTLRCKQCLKVINVTPDEMVQKELEEISSLELDTQFDADSPGFVQETPSPTAFHRQTPPTKPRVARNLLQSIFGSSTPVQNDIILADESPVRDSVAPSGILREYVPDSMPYTAYERTPAKYSSQTNQNVSPVTPSQEIVLAKKQRFESGLINQTAGMNLLFSPLKRSPKTKSPRSQNKTSGKRALKKTHRISAEPSQQGIRKLSQTQLNLDCFKKHGLENENQVREPRTPLNILENNDLDETNLTLSAVRRLANNDDQDCDAKEVFISSYDRIPEGEHRETRKECRKKLPGLECQDCVQWYNHFDNGEEVERRRLLDKFSRHRTKNVALPETPEGYWKPMLTPLQKD